MKNHNPTINSLITLAEVSFQKSVNQSTLKVTKDIGKEFKKNVDIDKMTYDIYFWLDIHMLTFLLFISRRHEYPVTVWIRKDANTNLCSTKIKSLPSFALFQSKKFGLRRKIWRKCFELRDIRITEFELCDKSYIDFNVESI